VAGDKNGNAYIVDPGSKSIWKTDATGRLNFISAGATFTDPYGIAVNWDGSRVYVADAGGKFVAERDPSGNWYVIGMFSDPYGVATDGANNVYVADPGTKRVYKLTR
jgi:DNA-binding beta-propeller fold protein YncE